MAPVDYVLTKADKRSSSAARRGVQRSSLTYVRPGVPPVLTVHGDDDTIVPYRHATRLHAELTKHGVRNELVTVPGGGHGGFSREQDEHSFAAIRAFLGALGLRGRAQ